jgi:hypothetical protein
VAFKGKIDEGNMHQKQKECLFRAGTCRKLVETSLTIGRQMEEDVQKQIQFSLMIYQVGLQLISPIFDIIFGPKYFISSLF